MEPIQTVIEYIVDLPRFKTERPFSIHADIEPGKASNPEDPKLNTITYHDRPVTVYDLRRVGDATIEKFGFQHINYDFRAYVSINKIVKQEVERYQLETEEVLQKTLKAQKVICYDCRFRRNDLHPKPGMKVDVNNTMFIDFPPRGVHNDVTFQSGPQLIKKILAEANQTHLLDKKYRFRIINTWRPLVEKLEDRPLALCDYQTIDGNDLLAADQIYPNLRTQLYYLKYNPAQRWYWLSHQTPSELMVFLMYDTLPKSGAKFCPHVSFHNPLAAPDAPMRESVETRSVVVSLASETS